MTVAPAGPPKKLGRFEVGAKIGGGGMASVYVGRGARDDGSEQLVALKVIREDFAHDEQFRTMFVDEAKILARLSHPNVIHTLEYGASGPHSFIAMELLSGRTYADVWDVLASRGETVPVRLGAWICARVAEGLHSAHELADESGAALSVVHRDVNPGNIFLTHAGGVKLIDFGLARARVRASKSVDGVVKGKIAYLAPEQAHGREIDRRVDVYALGATLWETSTMKRLFKRDNDVATLKAIRDAHVPDIRQMVPAFPDRLWEIIEKALARDVGDRYPTAAAMMQDLDAFVAAEPRELERELSSTLGQLFPGQEARHARWVREATSVRLPMATLPPPAPVPTASSTLLQEEGSTAPSSATPGTTDGGPPVREGPEDAGRRRPRPSGAADRIAAQAIDAHAPRRMWVSLLVVAAVVLAALWIVGGR